MIRLAELHKQYLTHHTELDAAIAAVIADSAYIGGKYVQQFEEDFAHYVGANYCIAVANGTDALEIAIEAEDIHGGSIIVPAMTAAPTVEAVIRSGNRPVFCDIDDTMTMNIRMLESLIDDTTEAILPVHLYGAPADIIAIENIACNHGLAVIEDCAQAVGTRFGTHHVGTIGNAGCFSFYPGKTLGAYGDGGAIVTNDPNTAEYCRKVANHGRSSKFAHDIPGRNSRMDGLQAAILSVKLKHLDEWITKRQDNAKRYDYRLVGEVELPNWHNRNIKYTFHQYPILVENRDEIMALLKQCGVEAGLHYPFALPDLPCYQQYAKGNYPVARKVAKQEISLPVHELLETKDLDLIMACLCEA